MLDKYYLTQNLYEMNFTLFDPKTSNLSTIPSMSGNYIWVFRIDCKLPNIGIKYQTKTICFNKQLYEVAYTGVGSDLHNRIKNHLGNNAGRSTLRKSIGSLLKLPKIDRDKTKNGKTKFTPDGENTVTQWIKDNMMVLYVPNNDYEEDELKLINQYNPPLNLKDNYNEINREFREELEKLRGLR